MSKGRRRKTISVGVGGRTHERRVGRDKELVPKGHPKDVPTLVGCRDRYVIGCRCTPVTRELYTDDVDSVTQNYIRLIFPKLKFMETFRSRSRRVRISVLP